MSCWGSKIPVSHWMCQNLSKAGSKKGEHIPERISQCPPVLLFSGSTPARSQAGLADTWPVPMVTSYERLGFSSHWCCLEILNDVWTRGFARPPCSAPHNSCQSCLRRGQWRDMYASAPMSLFSSPSELPSHPLFQLKSCTLSKGTALSLLWSSTGSCFNTRSLAGGIVLEDCATSRT